VVRVSERCRLSEPWICGATTKASMTMVNAVPMSRELPSLARSCGTWVIAEASEP
jgi:hypothetical protein